MGNLRLRESKSMPLPCSYVCYITQSVFEASPPFQKTRTLAQCPTFPFFMPKTLSPALDHFPILTRPVPLVRIGRQCNHHIRDSDFLLSVHLPPWSWVFIPIPNVENILHAQFSSPSCTEILCIMENHSSLSSCDVRDPSPTTNHQL